MEQELINKMAEAAHNEIKTIDVVKKALAAIQEDYVLVRKEVVVEDEFFNPFTPKNIVNCISRFSEDGSAIEIIRKDTGEVIFKTSGVIKKPI